MTASALSFLQEIENELEKAIASATRQYEDASLGGRPHAYMVLAKLRERRTTINSALIDLLQDRISIAPPSESTVKRTAELTTELQKLTNAVQRFDATLDLLSDLSVLITKIIKGS